MTNVMLAELAPNVVGHAGPPAERWRVLVGACAKPNQASTAAAAALPVTACGLPMLTQLALGMGACRLRPIPLLVGLFIRLDLCVVCGP